MDSAITSALLDRLVARLRQMEPDLQGVLAAGSLARGRDDAYSDVDLVALTLGPPRVEERIWFERADDGRLVHVSTAVERLEPPGPQEPAEWALGFPCVDVQRWLWATPHARTVLGDDPTMHMPAAPGELEDFVELARKVRRAAVTGERLLQHWACRMLAERAAGLLRELNPERIVSTPIEALAAARGFAYAPEHYREDFDVCTGLAPADDERVRRSAERLVGEMLDYLKARYREDESSDVVRRALVDGTLHEYLAR